jgi:uncharacterized protein YuzE
MKFTYDPRYNIAYLCFREKRAEVESIHVSDELVVDIAPDGTIYGIELLNANEQIKRDDSRRLLFINEATGEKVE